MPDFERSKYKSWASFQVARFRRIPLDMLVRWLVRWRPIDDPEPGYTVIIACNYNLRTILDAVLQLIDRQDRTNLKELMVAFELTESQLPESFKREIQGQFPGLPITFLTYNPFQSFVARAIDWPWLYSWLSWTKGISRSRTKYVLIHDYDALVIRPDFFEDRYRLIQEQGLTFLGVSNYAANGIEEADGFATTWELMIDAQAVRARFRPLDIFNRVGRYKDRLIEFDTFLYAETQFGTTKVLPVGMPSDLVHLSQVISQHTQALNGRQKVVDHVLFVPYMMYVGGYEDSMRETGEALRIGQWPDLSYFGKKVKLLKLDGTLARWMAELAEQVERTLVGEPRPAVLEYFKAIETFATR